MPENTSDVALESIESGESLQQLLDRALEECGRQVAGKAAPTRGGLRKLHGLIRLANRAQHHDDSEKLAGLFDELLVLCHKINNPLTSILGRAQIMQIKLGADTESPFVKPIRVVEESSQRIAALVVEMANLLCVGRKIFVDRTLQDYDSGSGSRRP